MRWRSRSEAETRALGRGLGAAAGEAGGVVTLSGPLGAGKTVFAKGVGEGLGVRPELLTSPTFTIAHEVATARGLVLVHADAYRLEAAEELLAAGLDDWLAPGHLLLLEWGDRFPQILPAERLEVHLAPGTEASEREITARPRGAGAQALLARWREQCP
jgi:tRNA threonylcarbamoyladenosine biosynthesis protein TsaE